MAALMLYVSVAAPAGAAPTIERVTVQNPYKGDSLRARWCAEISEYGEGIQVIWMGTSQEGGGWTTGVHWGDYGIPPIPAGADTYCMDHRYSSSGPKLFKVDVYGASESYPFNFVTGLWETTVRRPVITLSRPAILSVSVPRRGTLKIRFKHRNQSVKTQCRLDWRPFRPCRSAVTYRGVRVGRHVFRVREVSSDGKVKGPVSWRAFRLS